MPGTIFEGGDEGEEIGGGAGAGVVDEVGVVVGNADPAGLHAARTDLFQEPTGGDFTFDDLFRRDGRAGLFREVLQQEVLEDAAGAGHGGWEFCISRGADVFRLFLKDLLISRFAAELGGENLQGLVFLEAGVAVTETALLVGPDADGGAVEKLDGFELLSPSPI